MQTLALALRQGSWRFLARLDGWANRVYGSRYNPLYHTGAIVVALLLVLLVTGLYLLFFYRLGSPWASVARITGQAWLGRWIRGVHRFASDAAVVATAVHAFRMFAQGRAWGPRALAWISGLVLSGVVLVCGWTGYVMVWDVQAQALAEEGARLLDVLPIFAEPIGRTFVGERPLPGAFFFLNLFAHVALPVGVVLLVWVHVSRVARPVLLPERAVVWGLVASLVALAVAWPVGMAPEADLFRLPEGVPLDVFFGFWLPVSRRLPAWVVWGVGGGAAAAVALVPWWARPRAEERPGVAVVDERACTGCEQCAEDCPFDAISMVERADGREGVVARVEASRCVGCGVCVGSCAPMVIGPAGRTGRDQRAGARAWAARERPGPGEVVVVGCGWSAAGRDEALSGARLFAVPCAGHVHTSTIELLLRLGAGGVLVAACPARDCRGREGGRWLEQRVWHGREAELQARVDRRRVRTVEAAAAEPEALREAIEAFRVELAAAAPEAGVPARGESAEPAGPADAAAGEPTAGGPAARGPGAGGPVQPAAACPEGEAEPDLEEVAP